MSNGTKPCPNCGQSRCSVYDSRPYNGQGAFWRRNYKCGNCGQKFTTLESVVAQKGVDFVDTHQAAARAFMEDVQAAIRNRFGDGRKSRRLGSNYGKEAE